MIFAESDAGDEVRQLSWESSGEKVRDLYAELCVPLPPATPRGTAP